MYIRKYISVYKKIYRSIYENIFPHMRKFRHLLSAIKTLTLNYLASEARYSSRIRRLSELLRCFDIFSWFVAHPNCQLFQYTTQQSLGVMPIIQKGLCRMDSPAQPLLENCSVNYFTITFSVYVLPSVAMRTAYTPFCASNTMRFLAVATRRPFISKIVSPAAGLSTVIVLPDTATV